MSPHASVQATDQSQSKLVDTARSFLCCDERIQVTFSSYILSDYVRPNDGRCSAQIPQRDTPIGIEGIPQLDT